MNTNYLPQTLTFRFILISVFAGLLVWPLVAPAAPGDLDTAFGGGGVLTPFDLDSDRARDVVVQPDGKIVVVGESRNFNNPNQIYDFGIARYNPDGTLDSTFHGDGRQEFGVGAQSYATAVALQADGKIVVVGYYFPGGTGYDYVVARFLPNGSIDTSFDDDGYTGINIVTGAVNDYAYGVAIQPDGKIVIVGETGGDFSIVRMNPNGSLDTAGFVGGGGRQNRLGRLGSQRHELRFGNRPL